jgi:two-component system, NtrC family, nitrogen regulation response regulator NtrX
MIGSRILVLEDDPNVRQLVEYGLIDAAYKVESTDTVAGAPPLLNDRGYDLLLADGRLPDGTGMMAADKARDHGTKALIVTGYAFELPKNHPYEVLQKPVSLERLIAAIERTLVSATPSAFG